MINVIDRAQSPAHQYILLDPRERREKRLVLESTMRDFLQRHPEAEQGCPLRHTFAPGAYARQIFIPQGTLVVGKIHKHAHLNMIMHGKALVATENGILTYRAPYVMTSSPGTKRVVYAAEDLIWVTVHLTNETDLDKIEAEIIAPTYDDYEAFTGIDVRTFSEKIMEVLTMEVLS